VSIQKARDRATPRGGPLALWSLPAIALAVSLCGISVCSAQPGEAQTPWLALLEIHQQFQSLRAPVTRDGVADYSALSLLISQRGATFFTDTYVSLDPSAEEIAETTVMAAHEIRRFGINPKAALVSHSNFGSRDSDSAIKMRRAMEIIRSVAPELEADGEMHGDSAISEILRKRVMPESTLSGEANLLVFPNLDAANIALGVVKTLTDALHVGPILLGSALPAHILSPSVTSRGVVNMATLAVVEASFPEQE
jgi:malate dehydrogenase (oxaloacetate-decarboxylating)(NADP+)